MKLPASLAKSKEWTLVGPMGPQVPKSLVTHPVLAVDGGAHFCSHIDVWIGDGDSYKSVVKCDHIFQFPQNKSVSDFALALSLFDLSGAVILHCWGFFGGRKDHEILNLGAILSFLDKNPGSEANFYDQDGRMGLKCVGSGEWPFAYQGTFSLACVKNARIKLLGSCLYPLPNETELEPLSSLGLSNVAQGQFTLVNHGSVMIFFPETT